MPDETLGGGAGEPTVTEEAQAAARARERQAIDELIVRWRQPAATTAPWTQVYYTPTFQQTLTDLFPPQSPRKTTPPVAEETPVPLVNAFLVGCDPEFVILDAHGALIPVDGFLPNPKDPIGYDHNGVVVELHPKPNRNTYRIVQELQKMVKDELWAGLPVGKFRAGAFVSWPTTNRERLLARGRMPGRQSVTLGGHVHLDLNPYKREANDLRGGDPGAEPDPFDVSRYDYSPYVPDHATRMRALDHFTHRLEALDILPREESIKRRSDGGGYGKWGQFRVTEAKFDWNNNRTADPHTEYRTMCSWMFDPKVAFLALTGAKLVAANPMGAFELLGKTHTFKGLVALYEKYKNDDVNAHRAYDTLESLGQKKLVVDPSADFRERWNTLGLGK